MAGTAVDEDDYDFPYSDEQIERVARTLEAQFAIAEHPVDFTELARTVLTALGPPLIAGTLGSGKGSVIWRGLRVSMPTREDHER